MFKKKRGRPSNAYKRKVKTMKILSLASIIAISGITIYGLSGYIKGNNDRLGASITKADGVTTGETIWKDSSDGIKYRCKSKGYTRAGNNECGKFVYPISDTTCNSDVLEKVGKKEEYKNFKLGVDAKKDNCDVTGYEDKCVKCENGKVKEVKEKATFYYCSDKKLKTIDKSSLVSENKLQCIDGPTVKAETLDSCKANCSKIPSSSDRKGCEDKCTRDFSSDTTPTDSGNTPAPTNTGETPTKDGKTDDSNDTPSEQNNDTPSNENNDNPSNEEKQKELPELKIISSNGTNLTNKEYSRNLCTNSPFYISGAKTSEVSIKSDKLKITNSSEKTSTDKAIIEPSKEIKKGEKVQITVTRTEDKKEAKVTFVNNTDCESLKICKKLGKININHGMTIMDKKVITLKQDAYFGLNLWVYPINVKEKSSQIVWKSSNPSVVEIIKKSDQGIQIHAKAKSNKAVKISATLGGKTTYFKVKVNAKKGKDNPGGYDNAPKMVNCDEKKSISTAAKIESIPNQKYTGKVITPTIKVTVDSKELKNGTDYELVYSNNVNPGEAKVRIIGKGLYTDSKVVTFTINSPEEKLSRITISKKTRNLSDEKCSKDPLNVTFTNVENINIEDVYYSTDNGKTWNVLKSEKEGPNATISLNKTYNYLLIKVKDEEGNYSKIYGPYNINIQKSCNTLKKVTTIKISGIKKETNTLSKNKKIKVKIQAKSNIKTVQISNDGKKTWVVSKKCSINKNEATCNIDSKHKSLYYRVITVNNEYQDFGEYKVK